MGVLEERLDEDQVVLQRQGAEVSYDRSVPIKFVTRPGILKAPIVYERKKIGMNVSRTSIALGGRHLCTSGSQ